MVTKKQLGEFNSIAPFNADYMLVERNGAYNLISINDGKYLSRHWYAEISARKGGGIDFVEKNTTRKMQISSNNIALAHNSYLTLKKMLGRKSGVLYNLNLSSVVVIPARCIVVDCKKINLIAEVELCGTKYLLGDDGKLYTKDGELYTIPNFFISHADIIRLYNHINKANKRLKENFVESTDEDSNTMSNLVMREVLIYAFGFNYYDSMEFNTAFKNIYASTETESWGGDTIKVRILKDLIPSNITDDFNQLLDNLGFTDGKSVHKYDVRTKQYYVKDLEKLLQDIDSMVALKS